MSTTLQKKNTTLLLHQAQHFFHPLKGEGEGSVVKNTEVLSLWTISGSLQCSETATAANDHFVGTSWNLWSATLHEDKFSFCSLIRPQWSVKCELIWTLLGLGTLVSLIHHFFKDLTLGACLSGSWSLMVTVFTSVIMFLFAFFVYGKWCSFTEVTVVWGVFSLSFEGGEVCKMYGLRVTTRHKRSKR